MKHKFNINLKNAWWTARAPAGGGPAARSNKEASRSFGAEPSCLRLDVRLKKYIYIRIKGAVCEVFQENDHRPSSHVHHRSLTLMLTVLATVIVIVTENTNRRDRRSSKGSSTVSRINLIVILVVHRNTGSNICSNSSDSWGASSGSCTSGANTTKFKL